MNTEPSLRERKKQATREALIEAAARLAVERGVENVRVEDIAACAGVSPRTYNNYFSSREEAICALRAERARAIGAALRTRPADEPLDEAIIAVFNDHEREPDLRFVKQVIANPALLGEFLKSTVTFEHELASAIAARTGTEPGLGVEVLAAALCAASRAATQRWVESGGAESHAELRRAALRQVIVLAADFAEGGHERK